MHISVEIDDYQDWDNWTITQIEDDEGPHCEDRDFNVSVLYMYLCMYSQFY